MSDERPTLQTRVGHAEWGDNRFRGHSVTHALAGRETVAGLFALAVVGRRLEDSERAMLDDLATATNVADPRIWPLKLVRVVSAFGSPMPAMAAAVACLDGARIGEGATCHAAAMLVELRDSLLAAGADPTEADDAVFEDCCRRWPADGDCSLGFEVPFRPRDERVQLLGERVVARGRAELPYWRLFVRAVDVVGRIRQMQPKITLLMGAIGLDMSFTPSQIGPLMTAVGVAAYWANAMEGSEQAPACLQRLPTDCVRYVGHPARTSPRAATPSE